MKNQRIVQYVINAGFIAGLTMPAVAQEAQPAIEEIIVSARKVAEDVQTVPISMSVISGEALVAQSVATLADIQGQVPNLFLQTHPSEPQSLSFAIRGQKQNDIAISLDPSVGLYIDGLYYPRTIGLRGALVDLERVEVLRGPQGTLYGRNTTGGAISLFSRQPTDELGGSLGVSLGTYSHREVTGLLNLPLSDSAALRLVAQKRSHDGYGRDGLGRDLVDEDSTYLRGKLRMALSDTVEATLSGSFHENDSGGSIIQLVGLRPPNSGAAQPWEGTLAALQTSFQGGLGLVDAINTLKSYIGGVGGDFYRTGGTEPGWSDVRAYNLGLDVDIELSSTLTLRSITGYQSLDRENNGDFDGTPFTLISALRTTDTSYASQEFQLLGGHETFNWVAGLYAGLEKGTDTTLGDAIPNLNPASPSSFDARVRYKSYAAFSQFNWQFAEDWRLTAGLRFSRDEREMKVFNGNRLIACLVPAPGTLVTGQPTNPNNGPALCPQTFDDSFSEPSWLVSLDHEFSENLMGYGKVAYGYRTGGRNQRGLNTRESFAKFDPETVTEYEVGLKADILDNRLRLNVALFWDDYEDAQRSTTVPTLSGAPTTVITNAAKAEVRGMELEAALYATDHLTLRAGIGLTDAKYDEFVDVTGDRTDEEFDVPEWTANFSGRYQRPVDWGQWAIQLDYQWIDEYVQWPTAINLNAVTQGSYGLVNARLSFNLRGLNADISLFGKNLTDEEYLAVSNSSEASLGYVYGIAGEPRTYGIEFVKRFGGL